MKKNAPLFVFDCDGTLELPVVFAYAQEKQKNKDMTMTLAEFKAAHPDEKKLMISGMADFIKYASEIGNVVLLSGGDPVAEGSKELKSLFPLFQKWEIEGKEVPFGREPTGLLKNTPEVAQGLRDYFNPSKVVVIGDSTAECELAKNIKADVLLVRGASEGLYQGLDTVPHKHTFQFGKEIIPVVQEDLKHQRRHRTYPRVQPRRPYIYPKNHSRIRRKSSEKA